jgi:hypothetical protein
MLKRTKGLLLLTLLVITGLAGTINDSSLSKKERKSVTGLMKSSRNDVFAAIKGLSEAQLNFKPSADQWSIKECVYHIAISERNLWGMLEASLKEPSNAEKRSEIKTTDDQLVNNVENRTNKIKTSESFEPRNAPYHSIDEALLDFKSTRADHLKYMKTTTEDLRNHVVELPFGWLDCYQLSLMIAAHSNRHTLQIEEVKVNPHFPKK